MKNLHLAEILPERLAEVANATDARTAVSDYRKLLAIGEIDAVYISATPESTTISSAASRCSANSGGI